MSKGENVPSYEVKDVLVILFENADALMEELSAESGEFTLKQFLHKATRHNQEAYIELLRRCIAHPSATPFNAAHQHFGNKLSELAQKSGYKRFKEGTVNDIFGNQTKNIVYRK